MWLRRLAAVARAVAQVAGAAAWSSQDHGTALIDLQADPAVAGCPRGFARSPSGTDSPLARALVQPGAFDVVVLPEAEYRAVAGGSTASTFAAVAAPIDAELVLVAPAGVAVPASTTAALAAAAEAAGWLRGATTTREPTASEFAGMRQFWKKNG